MGSLDRRVSNKQVPSKRVQELLAAFEALPVAEREQFQGMLPQYKLFQRTEGHDQDLKNMYSGIEAERKQREADSRKLTGLAKNAATLNTNEQKHHQLIQNGINALDGGQIDLCAKLIDIHSILIKLGLIQEHDKKETDQFRGNVIELLEQIKEKLS